MKYKSQFCVFAIGMLMLTAVSICHAQEKIRTVEHGKYRKYDIRTEPIAIVSRELGDKLFMNESQVVGGSDWLRDLTLSVKNISKKPIVKFSILLTIDKQGNMTGLAAMEFSFPSPRESVLDADGKPTSEYQPLKVLKPGGIVKVKVSDNQLRILDDLKKADVGDIERVSIGFRQVVFDDGTGWFQGLDTREDPNRPGSMIPIRPDRPGPTLSQRFSKWLSSFAFINEVSQPLDQFALMLPVKSRFSFASINMNTVVPLPTPTPECGWLDGTFATMCAAPQEGACTATLGTCWYDKDRIWPDDVAGTFGRILYPTGYWCKPQPNNPDQGACNIDTGGCQDFELPV